MGTFFKSLFSEIKSDLKSEIRTESRGVTRDAVKGIKGIFKKKKTPATQPVQNPQMVNNQPQVQPQPVYQQPVQPQKSKEELYAELQNERLLGKDFDEWKDTFERLASKYGNNMEAISNDEEFKAMQKDAREYFERVYMPSIKESINIGKDGINELNQVTKDRMDMAQQHYDEYNKDGVISQEEDAQMTVEGMQIMGENFKDVGELAPKYMDQLGDMFQGMSSKIENESFAKSAGELGDKLKNSEYQQEIKDKFAAYGQANVEMAEKFQRLENTSIPTEGFNEAANTMQNNFKEAADAVDMTDQDIENAIEEGKNMSSKNAVEENAKKTMELRKLAENGASEEEIKEAAKDSLTSAVSAFASMFGGDD